jgi:signal transduction histidine kinase/pSer/pThr/pTyr-binding forkhead associated (FHA) protein
VITLLVLQGPDKGRRFELPDKPALIGRESRQLPLGDNTVSRRHCELRPGDNDQWILRDLASSNGTWVNGQRVDNTAKLRLGDQIRVGRTLLVFGAQPGVTRASSGNVSLAGAESGMDSAIINTLPSNDDSIVLAVPEPAAAAMANLKILYRLSAALGSSFSIDQALEVVMDLVFEHVKADRGVIMIWNAHTQELVPKIARLREEGQDPADTRSGVATTPSTIQASRTIVNHVLTAGEGVLSSNAMSDPRFSAGKSVHDLGIRSALCVPIKARRLDHRLDDPNVNDEVVGVIYIDSSVRNFTYSTDQLRLLTVIGMQAGLAIQNASLYQQGLAAERFAAIGETTAALSHSIKNILQALRGGADVVEMGFRSGNLSQAQKGWRVVDRNLERIYNLTMNLLAYSKQREPQLQLVNPRTIIDECLELIAPMANEKGVMAVADVDRDLPAVPLDPDGIHQMLMNLLSNSLDAVESHGGLIRVSCRYDAAAKRTVIEVNDNGPGIPETVKPHLFELFHSTKGNRGTGLGLAVAKKIVDEHDGTITIESTPGEGATFIVRLPAYHESIADPSHTHGG